jgi:hypothetical protein
MAKVAHIMAVEGVMRPAAMESPMATIMMKIAAMVPAMAVTMPFVRGLSRYCSTKKKDEAKRSQQAPLQAPHG